MQEAVPKDPSKYPVSSARPECFCVLLCQSFSWVLMRSAGTTRTMLFDTDITEAEETGEGREKNRHEYHPVVPAVLFWGSFCVRRISPCLPAAGEEHDSVCVFFVGLFPKQNILFST
ncbi:MAG: uncharacterized protein A8A55_2123 [Amphiamblys sp. WSBS2006]|nr:MAG: uncharacterized protein A8A55_2123 [Amphiamblys sp. WSBS2006]